MESIVESILHEYPYPIAKCYEKVLGARDILDRWNKIRYLFETTLQYCSCITIAQYLQTTHDDQKINFALTYLTRPTLGHWLNLFRLCSKYNQLAGATVFAPDIFEKSKEHNNIISGLNSIKEFLEPGKKIQYDTASMLGFMEVMVTYRNKTAGHGSPQSDHIEKYTPILEKAIIDLLLHLDILSHISLVYLSEIRVERQSFVHTLYRLMGTSKVLIRDYLTSREKSLIGFDKQLFICSPDTEIPAFTLHPLVICSTDEVFMLQSSDLKHNIEYLCHHTGSIYTADRIFEDFKERFGSFFSEKIGPAEIDVEKIYIDAVRMSLVDGTIQEEERAFLDEMRSSLDISDIRAQEIETLIWQELNNKSLSLKAQETSQESKKVKKSPSSQVVTVQYSPRILFFPYASVRLGFWADFVSRLAALAHKRGMVFSMVAPDPLADYDSAFMTANLAEMNNILETHKPDLIIMVPSPSRAFMELFQKLFINIKAPLMTIDTEFFGYEFFHKNNLQVPPIVQIDNREGGRMAAKMLLERIPNDIGRVNFLTMPGIEDAPHSRARILGFEEFVNQTYPDSRVKVLPSGGFQRLSAQQVFKNFLEDADLSRYQGIFCCNDEMALGVYTVLCSQLAKDSENLVFGIVGFNNTIEMQNMFLVDKTDKLVGTIDQNLSVYIDAIFSITDKLLKGEIVQERYLIRPIPIKRS